MRFVTVLLALPFAGLTSQAKTVPLFEDGQAQAVAGFADSTSWIRQHLWVETGFDTDGDGRPDRMHVDVTRPAQTDTEGLKLPVIYETSPYFAGTGNDRSKLWDVHQEVGGPPPPRTSQAGPLFRSDRTRISNGFVSTWVPRGFIVVHSESPGTGLSQGCPTVGGPNEELAPKAVIDWLNGRALGFTAPIGGEPVVASWTTGLVGMTGTSYNGTLPLAAATTGVEGLKAIIPVSPNTSYWHYYRSNGLVRHPGGWLGEDIDFLYDFINSGDDSKRAYCNATVRDGEMAAGRDRVSGDWNQFWADRDYWLKLGGIKAATLMAHGFNDWNVMPLHTGHVVEALKESGVPLRVYWHQGGHGGPPPDDMMNRWFTRFLFGVQNGVEDGPQAWIVREDAARDAPTPYATWPNPAARPVMLQPTGGGEAIGFLVANRPTSRVVRTGNDFSAMAIEYGKESFTDDVAIGADSLAKLAASPHRLIYATPELTQPVHLSGAARVTVRLAFSRPAANLSVYLVALPWLEPNDRRQSNFSLITREWADLRNRHSVIEEAAVVPGTFYEMSFDLQPDDQIIPAGKRIGLMIFSSDRDFTLWPAAGTELTLDLSGTSITLPVVGGEEAWSRAVGSP
jgi:X-Pro dipeptidyl-peptidase